MPISGNARFLRVILLFLLLTGTLVACGDSDDEDKKDEEVTIGIINLVEVLDVSIEGFKAEMVNQGYVEGENITYIYNGAVGSADKLDAEVQKLLDEQVDLIVSVSTPATLSAQRATAGTSVPVVFLIVTDPIAAGLVEDLTSPRDNLTGIMTGQSGSKQLERFQTLVPDLQRVFVPYNPDDPSPSNAIQEIRKDATNLGIELVVAETPDGEAVLAALQIMPEDIDGILVIPDSIVGSQIEGIMDIALERNIPVAGSNPQQLEMGALLTLGAQTEAIGAQGARLCAQVIKGTPAGDLPIETAEYYWVINLTAAETLGITIPNNILSLADEIYR